MAYTWVLDRDMNNLSKTIIKLKFPKAIIKGGCTIRNSVYEYQFHADENTKHLFSLKLTPYGAYNFITE